MKYLLDTHTLLWALENNPNLPENIKDIIDDERNTIYVSVVSLWEIAIKNKINKLPYDSKQITNICTKSGYIFQYLGCQSVNSYSDLRIKDGVIPNKDPFDQMLVAQSKVLGIPFLTHDEKMKYFDEPTIVLY